MSSRADGQRRVGDVFLLRTRAAVGDEREAGKHHEKRGELQRRARPFVGQLVGRVVLDGKQETSQAAEQEKLEGDRAKADDPRESAQ